MPPIACAPRRWQTATSCSVKARIIGAVSDAARSGRTNGLASRNTLITLNR